MMTGFLNAGSVLLGLIAWAMPVAGMLRHNKAVMKSRMLFSVVSFGACAFSLWLQMAEIRQRVMLQDWSALMDTIEPLVKVSLVFVAITVLLNVAALMVPARRQSP